MSEVKDQSPRNMPFLIKRGNLETPDSTQVYVTEKLPLLSTGVLYVWEAMGATVPSLNENGYLKGATFFKTNQANGTAAKYQNVGDESNCQFELMAGAETVITGLTAGYFLIGGGSTGDLSLAVGVAVKNTTGSTIAKGTGVYISGYNGANLISPADPATGRKAELVLDADLTNNSSGTAYPVASLTNINTNGATIGDPIYLGTGGAFTLTKPTAINNTVQIIGRVITVNATTGTALFFPGLTSASRLSPDVANPPSEYMRFYDDFMGQALDATNDVWATKDTSAAGTPTFGMVEDATNGQYSMAFDTQNETQILTLYQNNKLHIDPTKKPVVEFRFKVGALNPNDTLVMGLCSDQNDTPDNATRNVWFRMEANMDLKMETDDNTTDNDDKQSAVTLAADTFETLRIDMSSLSSIKFYRLVSGSWVDITNGFTFSAAALNANMQFLVQLQKTSGAQTTAFTIDYVDMKSTR